MCNGGSTISLTDYWPIVYTLFPIGLRTAAQSLCGPLEQLKPNNLLNPAAFVFVMRELWIST